jgi:hypothetical protein
MVSVKLIGRMANQMFQICCCISYALKHGLEYHIPAHTLNDNVWKPIFTHLENPKWNEDEHQGAISESKHSFDEIPSPQVLKDIYQDIYPFKVPYLNIVIEGYRQSIKYFEDYLPEIRKAFGFDYTVKKEGWVALHKRLGDYKNYPTKHPIITDEYISKALSILKEKGYSKCIVFSDEINECQQTINSGIYPDWFFGYSIYKTELQDFQSMLECESFIISNSTFSLMAAILSESKDKICISPSSENWFGVDNGHLDTSTIIPDSFIQIKY